MWRDGGRGDISVSIIRRQAYALFLVKTIAAPALDLMRTRALFAPHLAPQHASIAAQVLITALQLHNLHSALLCFSLRFFFFFSHLLSAPPRGIMRAAYSCSPLSLSDKTCALFFTVFSRAISHHSPASLNSSS